MFPCASPFHIVVILCPCIISVISKFSVLLFVFMLIK